MRLRLGARRLLVVGALLAAAAALAVGALSSEPAGAQQGVGQGLTIVSDIATVVSNLEVSSNNTTFSKESCNQHSTSFTTGGSSSDSFRFWRLYIAHDTAADTVDELKVALHNDGTGSAAGTPGTKLADLDFGFDLGDRAAFFSPSASDGRSAERVTLTGGTTYHVVLPDVNDGDHVFAATAGNGEEALHSATGYSGWSIGDSGKRTFGCPSSGKTWGDWTYQSRNYKLRFDIQVSELGPWGLEVREENRKLTYSWFSIPTDGKMQVRHKRTENAWGNWVDVPDVAGQPATSWTATGLNNRYNYDFQVRSDKTGANHAVVYSARPTNLSSATAIGTLTARSHTAGAPDGMVELSFSRPQYQYSDGKVHPISDTPSTVDPDDIGATGIDKHRRVTFFTEVRWKVKDAADSTYSEPARIGRGIRKIFLGIFSYEFASSRRNIFGNNPDDEYVQARLVPRTEYTFQVRSDRGDGSWATVHATAEVGPPAPVFGANGDRRGVVTFPNSTVVADHMQYRYKKQSATTWGPATDGSDVEGNVARYVVVPGLDNGTRYHIQVRSDVGDGTWSDTVAVLPAAETTLTTLPTPQNLTAELRRDGKIWLSWDKVTAQTDDWSFYAVRYGRGGVYPLDLRAWSAWFYLTPGFQGGPYPRPDKTLDESRILKELPGAYNEFILNETRDMPPLKVNNRYSFQVAVVTAGFRVGPASNTAVKSVITSLGASSSVEMTPHSGPGAHLKWRAVEHADKYQVRHAAVSSGRCGSYGAWADVGAPSFHNFRVFAGWETRYRDVSVGREKLFQPYQVPTWRHLTDAYASVSPSGMALGSRYCLQMRAVTDYIEGGASLARVKNTGIGGSGPHGASWVSMTPLRAPRGPSALSAASGDGRATVCWNKPADTDPNTVGFQTDADRYAIRGWQYSLNAGPGKYWHWLGNIHEPAGQTNRMCGVISGLADGGYTISVRSTGKSGDNFPDDDFPFLERAGPDRHLAGGSATVTVQVWTRT